jgi:hypothetical protein
MNKMTLNNNIIIYYSQTENEMKEFCY